MTPALPRRLTVLGAIAAGLAGVGGVAHLRGEDSCGRWGFVTRAFVFSWPEDDALPPDSGQFSSHMAWCDGRPVPWRLWSERSDQDNPDPVTQWDRTNWPLVAAALCLGAFGPAALLTLWSHGLRSRRGRPVLWVSPRMAATLRVIAAGGAGGVVAAAVFTFWLWENCLDQRWPVQAPGWSELLQATNGPHDWLKGYGVTFTWPAYSWVTAAGALAGAAVVARRERRGLARR